jgi:hypothetical protein
MTYPEQPAPSMDPAALQKEAQIESVIGRLEYFLQKYEDIQSLHRTRTRLLHDIYSKLRSDIPYTQNDLNVDRMVADALAERIRRDVEAVDAEHTFFIQSYPSLELAEKGSPQQTEIEALLKRTELTIGSFEPENQVALDIREKTKTLIEERKLNP